MIECSDKKHENGSKERRWLYQEKLNKNWYQNRNMFVEEQRKRYGAENDNNLQINGHIFCMHEVWSQLEVMK